MKKIKVYYQGWGAQWCLGELAEWNSKLIFEYSSEALSKKIEFSPLKAKLNQTAYSGFPEHQMRLPGFIADSLPDGWGMLLMDRAFKKMGKSLNEVSSLDRLCFIGNRSMGALSYEPLLFQPKDLKELTLAKVASQVKKYYNQGVLPLLSELVLNGGSPHGARPKILLDYSPKTGRASSTDIFAENSKVGQDKAPWIFKFPAQNEKPEVCALEKLYSDMARISGLSVSDSEYFELEGSMSAFGSKRFDRKRGHRVPMLTLAGALDANFRVPSSVDYSTFLRFTRLITQNEAEVENAFRLAVFNLIFNNRDDHPKNFSYTLNKNLEWCLSPAYDLTFNTGPGGEHQMDYCGEGKSPGLEHLMRLAAENDISKKNVSKVLAEVGEGASQFLKKSSGHPVSKKTLNLVFKAIQGNLKACKL